MRVENQAKKSSLRRLTFMPRNFEYKCRSRIPSLDKKAKTSRSLPGVLGRRVIDKEGPRHNPGEAESTRQVEDRLPAQMLDDDGSCVETKGTFLFLSRTFFDIAERGSGRFFFLM
jgi:hypothetical protein